MKMRTLKMASGQIANGGQSFGAKLEALLPVMGSLTKECIQGVYLHMCI